MTAGTRKAVVLLNAAAGTLAGSADGDEGARIVAAFAAAGVEAAVRHVPAEELPAAAREAAQGAADLVVAGGGDGTINAVASQLVGTGKPLALLPLGTLNQLAKELGVPSDLEAACAALARGQVSPFNVGQVNDRYFLSFSGIGIYAHVVKHRDAQRRVLGRGKWPAMAAALVRVLRFSPLFRVRVRAGPADLRRLTPLVFVALSEYQMNLFGVNEYACPEPRGGLSLYVARGTSRLGLVGLMVRAALRRLRPRRDFEAVCVREAEVTGPRRRHFRVALDGEIVDLPTPLRYRLVEGGLQMVMPRPPDEGGGGGRPGAPHLARSLS